MPSFPQYTLETFLCLLIFLGYYRIALRDAPGFAIKQWYLRLAPVTAFLLPLLPELFAGTEPDLLAAVTVKMNLADWWHKDLPDFTISYGWLLKAIYFIGFMVAALRLTDKFWAIGQFLIEQGNQPTLATGWQGAPTVRFSQLFFQWELWNDAKKKEWAEKWLPLHPVFAWEALFLSLLCAINWWNPVMHGFLKDWQQLYGQPYSTQTGFPASRRVTGELVLTAFLAASCIFVPKAYSPAVSAGTVLTKWSGQTVFEHKNTRGHSYTFEWGAHVIPLTKYANPNGFSGELELELTDFQYVLNQKIKVYKDGTALKTGILSILYHSETTGSRAYINGIDPDRVILKDRRQDKIYNDSISPGDELILFGEAEGIYLSKVQIRIRNPLADYEPVVKVPDINHLEATSVFQIIGRAGKRALVKIDAGSPGSRRIREMYKDPTQYEIVDIPGFRTNRRYLSESEALSSQVSAAGTDLAAGLPDVYYLPEYQGYQNHVVKLDWGLFAAAPSSPNYPEKQFLTVLAQEPVLSVGDKKLEITSFEVIIAGKNVLPAGFRTDRLSYPAIQEALQQLRPETSIYFDRLVVRDDDGVLKLFPVSFAFNVGKNAPVF